MSFAIAALSRLFTPLQVPAPAPTHVVTEPVLTSQPPKLTKVALPLRITRVAESALPSHLAGRMMISGRLDDVCRELARLEALHGDRPM